MTRLLAGDGGDEILAGNSRYLEQLVQGRYARLPAPLRAALRWAAFRSPLLRETPLWRRARQYIARSERSEEHTSELQSLMRISYAAFCLKKKQRSHKTTTAITI